MATGSDKRAAHRSDVHPVTPSLADNMESHQGLLGEGVNGSAHLPIAHFGIAFCVQKCRIVEINDPTIAGQAQRCPLDVAEMPLGMGAPRIALVFMVLGLNTVRE
jgi:hypothetical protein